MSKLALDIYAEVGVPNSIAAMASGGGAVMEVGSTVELDAAVGGARATAVHFWAASCDASKQMDEDFAHLAVDFPHVLFLRVRTRARSLLLLSDSSPVVVVDLGSGRFPVDHDPLEAVWACGHRFRLGF
ncbi:uncharacterized protein LOC123395338 isoform X2 [Hordeum vulgare subsp. vulgare]|uniref:uncharacterized protein LOC123395338 isoform X2 n=1 Tax=Hordeum vulgare subsp. vulgare TaxID=112509 RepID=UPI001D1A41E4|nr:uncharacterized protein LOC123395338 isoform X2 [Hordeum vulgare subsp. vulgare]